MAKRLAKFGFHAQDVERMIRREGGQKRTTPFDRSMVVRQPRYPKVHCNHLSVETLTYLNIPYKYDEYDRDYIIILQEMDESVTDALFAHSKRLREEKLRIEPAKSKPRYSWSRKKAKGGAQKLQARVVKVTAD